MDPADVIPTDEAVRRYPRLRDLQTLMDLDWRFIHHEDPDGKPLHLDGFLCWPDGVTTDALSVHSETNAFGVRTIGESDIVWQLIGTLPDVIEGLLQLPAPHEPNAPHLVIANGSPLWTPNQNR